MTSQQDMDKFVTNPYTGRLIKKGSKTHKRLVSAKLLDEPLSNAKDNLIIEANDTSEAKSIKTRMAKKSIGENKVITTRNNKVLKANRRPRQKEIIDKVSDIAVSTVLENRDDLTFQDMNDQEMDEYIKRLIQIKLIGGNTNNKPKQTRAPQKPTQQQYEDEYYEDDYYNEYDELVDNHSF